jgi:hypothetical protein
MMEGLFQPVHLLIGIPLVVAACFGIPWLLVRVVRNAWKG